jgi:hypothetical protein
MKRKGLVKDDDKPNKYVHCLRGAAFNQRRINLTG